MKKDKFVYVNSATGEIVIISWGCKHSVLVQVETYTNIMYNFKTAIDCESWVSGGYQLLGVL